MIEITSPYTEGQQRFLRMADAKKIDAALFGPFVPEIRYEEAHPDSSKPTISYVHNGGTLMMVPSQKNKSVLSFENALDIPRVIEICDSIANIRNRFNVIGIFLANQDSKEVEPSLWTATAATLRTIYEQIDGAVIGHGTHTLEYSTAALSFSMRQPAIPMVYTASQIPIIGHPGSDGIGNLTGAMEIAAYGNLAEVVAYANGTIFRGSRVTKKNDQRLDLFESRVTGPLGYFTAGGIETVEGARRRGGKQKYELLFNPKFSTHVTALKLQPGMNPRVIDELLAGTQHDVGLILETYGSGAVPRKLVETLGAHVQRGFPIFVSSSCAESGISKSMQLHDEDAIAAHQAGVRNVGDMTTSAATVKLMHIMGNVPNATIEKVEHEMRKNYAGEITPQSSVEDY